MAKKFGDRKDGAKLRNIHAMHLVMPLMYPNRCDNEAFISERIDLTNVLAYLDEKNASDPDYKYNFFQVMVTIMLKVITLRPKMNRFIANKTMYQRNEVSAAFTVKKEFSDDGGEALAPQLDGFVDALQNGSMPAEPHSHKGMALTENAKWVAENAYGVPAERVIYKPGFTESVSEACLLYTSDAADD